MKFKTNDSSLTGLVACLNAFYEDIRRPMSKSTGFDYIQVKSVIREYYDMGLICVEKKQHLEGQVKFIWQNKTRAEELSNLSEEIISRGGYVRALKG